MQTRYHCPVVGCEFSVDEEVDTSFQINTEDRTLALVQAHRQVTETALSNHVLTEHTIWDFLSTARSYQMFLTTLMSRLKQMKDSMPSRGGDYYSGVMIAVDEIAEFVIDWREENNAR